MSDLAGFGIIMWVVLLFVYTSICCLEASFVDQKLPMWAHPGLALMAVLCLAMASALLYVLALPILYLFGG